MRPARALLVLATAAVAAALCRPAHAAHPPPTRETTLWTVAIDEACHAAHGVDRIANAGFCRAHLVTRPGARDAASDPRALAEVAAAMGVSHASDALYEIERALERRRRRGDGGAVARRALERCGTLYGAVRERYAAARDAVAEARYGDVGTQLGGVLEIAQLCESGFQQDPSPHWLEDYAVQNTQFARIAVAITSLIKDKE